MNLDKKDKPNEDKTNVLQEKNQHFPQVLIKFRQGGNIIHTMSRVKQPQEALGDETSSSCSNLDSKQLDGRKKALNTPEVVFKRPYILMQRLAPKELKLVEQKNRENLTPPNKVNNPSNKENLKKKFNCKLPGESPSSSKMDSKANNVSDLFSTLTNSTRPATVMKTQELKIDKNISGVKTNQNFNQIVEYIIQSTNNNDSLKIGDVIIQKENLLSRSIMEQLVNETAKLKASGATKTVLIDKLFTIFNIMELNIRGGDQISFHNDNEDGKMERVVGAVDACLVCLYIMTSPNMPKRIYLEDVINRVVLCIMYQLENVIFPTFDGTYVLENKTSGTKKKFKQIPEDLYDKIVKLINLLTEFLNIQLVTDALVRAVSSVVISSFFIENIEKLRPGCLELIKTIFTRYEAHQRFILAQILAFAVRRPNTKHELGKENIHVLTAIVLQLLQCVTIFPESLADDVLQSKKAKKVNKDNLICDQYGKATNIAGTFLTMFLNQCLNKSEEDTDHKRLFENFIQDLISIANKPKWPASVLLLNLLGRILLKRFSDKQAEIFARVTSLDYLCLIAVWLRKGAILMQNKMEVIDEMIKKIKHGDEKKQNADSKEEKLQFLQEVLLDFLAENGKNDEGIRNSRHFYIAQWYSEASEQVPVLLGDKATKTRNEPSIKNKRKRKRGQDGTYVSNIESPDETTARKYHKLEESKKLLLNKLQLSNKFTSSKNCRTNYDEAELVIQYLVWEHNFSENFIQYLKAILIALKEPVPVVRTKVLKCLSILIEVDPSLLARNDIQMGISYSFLDPTPAAREAVVDLTGKFVLRQPELLDKYYELLSARILDTSAAVRKKVINILKDICNARPDFSKVPEICLKMMRRVNDEGGVGKLVVDVFQSMWFTPGAKSSLLQKIVIIADVVAASKDVSLIWFEQLLENLYKPKQDKFGTTKIQKEPPKPLLLATKQIIDCVMENMLKLKDPHDANPNLSQRLVSYSTTIHLFANIQPRLLVKHAQVMQPFLNLKGHSKENVEIISDIARTLALVVPLIPNPHKTFLAQLEQDCVKLAIQRDRPVLISSLMCLASIINNVTRSYSLVRDCFMKYYDYLAQIKLRITSETEKSALDVVKQRQYVKRAILIVGLLSQHFDFNDNKVIGDLPENIVDQAFEAFLFFLQQDGEDIQANAIKAIGAVCTRHFEFMLEKKLKAIYQRILTTDDAPLAMKSEVLINIESYLVEEDQRMMEDDLKYKNRSKQGNLKKMDDGSSGMASSVIQQYLKEILESYLNPNIQVREPALRVVQLIMRQGLVHPIQIVPYLICMSTDCEEMVSHGADKQLLELEKKHPGLIHTKSSLGIKLSYRLQKIMQKVPIIRGFRLKAEGEGPISLNGYLYSVLRSSRQQRRGMILNMLKQFDEEHTTLPYMLYLADNIAHFSYMVQDEPLFIIHHIDMMISVSGTNLLQSFREGLIKTETQQQQIESPGKDLPMEVSALDEDDDKEVLLTRLPQDTSNLQACLTSAQGYLLLLMLKQHLKDAYGLNDSKIQQYSPIESAKLHEKPINGRCNKLFNPTTTISKLQEDSSSKHLDEEGKKNLIDQYLEFKQLMLKLDRDDNDERGSEEALTPLNSPRRVTKSTSASNSMLVESEQVKSNKLVGVSNKRKSGKSQTPKKSRTPKPKKKKRRSSYEETEKESSDSDFVP